MDYFVALKNAKKAANSVSEVPDRGTCNHDTPYITDDVDERELREMAEALDLFITKGYGIAEGGWMINGLTKGQGNRRTKMAEEAAKALKKEGFDAHVFYAMD